jgi:hypothetical protein
MNFNSIKMYNLFPYITSKIMLSTDYTTYYLEKGTAFPYKGALILGIAFLSTSN